MPSSSDPALDSLAFFHLSHLHSAYQLFVRDAKATTRYTHMPDSLRTQTLHPPRHRLSAAPRLLPSQICDVGCHCDIDQSRRNRWMGVDLRSFLLPFPCLLCHLLIQHPRKLWLSLLLQNVSAHDNAFRFA